MAEPDRLLPSGGAGAQHSLTGRPPALRARRSGTAWASSWHPVGMVPPGRRVLTITPDRAWLVGKGQYFFGLQPADDAGHVVLARCLPVSGLIVFRATTCPRIEEETPPRSPRGQGTASMFCFAFTPNA